MMDSVMTKIKVYLCFSNVCQMHSWNLYSIVMFNCAFLVVLHVRDIILGRIIYDQDYLESNKVVSCH